MKIVIHTQHTENYAAHNEGYVHGVDSPYWKFKGGDTYIVHGVSIEDNMSKDWWKSLEDAIESRNEMFEEYILGMAVIDEIDFNEEDHVEEWESPINLSLSQGRWLATRYTKADQWSYGVVGKLEQWVQKDGDREDYVLMYELENSTFVTYKEWVESKNGEAA